MCVPTVGVRKGMDGMTQMVLDGRLTVENLSPQLVGGYQVKPGVIYRVRPDFEPFLVKLLDLRPCQERRRRHLHRLPWPVVMPAAIARHDKHGRREAVLRQYRPAAPTHAFVAIVKGYCYCPIRQGLVMAESVNHGAQRQHGNTCLVKPVHLPMKRVGRHRDYRTRLLQPVIGQDNKMICHSCCDNKRYLAALRCEFLSLRPASQL